VIKSSKNKDGVTKFEANWWGCQLYISHADLEKIDTVATFTGLIAGLGLAASLGPLSAIFAL
jgi:hypothetical protein